MSDANKDFADFGNKALILAILYLIAFILALIGWANRWVSYASLVVLIVILVFLIIATGNIGNAGKKLNNEDLRSFRTRIIVAAILVTLGLILATVGYSVIMFTLQTDEPGSTAAVLNYIRFGILLLIGIILLIIGAIFELLAWTDMKGFFRDNLSMFPENIGNSAKTGSLLCMIGAILTLTFILAPFGYLLRAIGYFMLMKLKDLE